MANSDPPDHRLAWLLGLVCLFIFLANLGGPALFEPDEGRNAEKGREILLLKDWVTPHENFLPALDKPMFFYWLVAISFKLLGVSEWSARLPALVAALACLFFVYRFAHRFWGPWEALWSVLILATSLEFFLLARIVLLDMTLTLFVTLALYSFYAAVHANDERSRRLHCVLMYIALGAGTVIKGLAGVVLPGMVYFFYLLFTKRWSVLGRLYLLPGAILYFGVVSPWYVWAEFRNPGYLRYFFWDEHLTRYVSDEFNRSKGWYYFFFVVAIGFLPWTALLPCVIKDRWQKNDDKNLFLILAAVLPFLFFSASSSQLPHYILPIFPALAILTAQAIVGSLHRNGAKSRILLLAWFICAGFLIYLTVGVKWPNLLVSRMRFDVAKNPLPIGIGAGLSLFIYGAYAWLCNRKSSDSRFFAILCTTLGMTVFFFVGTLLLISASFQRSVKLLAQNSAPFLNEKTQVIAYNIYPTGLIFYLRLDRPIWIVAPRGRSSVMGSPYIARTRPSPALGYGKVLFPFDELPAAWKRLDQPVLVFTKEKHLDRLNTQVGSVTKQVTELDDYVVLTKE